MRRIALFAVVAIAGTMAFSVPAVAGGGCHASGEPTSGRGAKGPSVMIEECMFTPTVLYVDVGAEVTWLNKDHLPHSVSGASLTWGTQELLQKGDHVTHAFKNEGVFPYYCVLHPSMVAAVVVGDPSASKAMAAPMDTDVEMLTGYGTDQAEASGKSASSNSASGKFDATPVSTTTEDAFGAPWFVVLLVAAGAAGVGATLAGTRRSRRTATEA